MESVTMQPHQESRKGQLSFDMGFAVIMVILIVSMIISFRSSSESSAIPGMKQMGLNSVADYTAGNLNEFYNSLQNNVNASYTFVLPLEFTVQGLGNRYTLTYNLSIDPIDHTTLTVTDGTQTATRELSFDFPDCSIPLFPKGPGEPISLSNCKISGTDILCKSICGETSCS